ncbi:MAG: ketoacyl-ACP synthase III [Opitutae bacterium]|nr:ketoacyl-ACP synthase III [Opitutae bacterium]
MHSQKGSVIISGIGSHLPEKVLTNQDLSKIVDTSDEWILSRTGIRQRHICSGEECTSDLATAAARKALDDAGLTTEDIDLLIVATITPDMPFPSTACIVQSKLGLGQIAAFDVEAACSGFLYTLDMASAMINSGRYRNAIVIGAEKLSSIIDWKDRATCVLFGDGAGAAVLSRSDEPNTGILDSCLHADGQRPELLLMPAGGSKMPASKGSLKERQHYLKMNGKEIFKFAVRGMERAAKEILDRQNFAFHDIDRIIPHQANMRIIETIQERLEIPQEKFYNNLQNYGNTSAASIPIALDEAYRKGLVQHEDKLLCLAFGAGLTWGSTLIKWHKP